MLPAQRTNFSTRQFTQPQLLAVLCLMRYEDWTFGETEVWFSEHSELRAQGEVALRTTRCGTNWRIGVKPGAARRSSRIVEKWSRISVTHFVTA